VPGPGTARRREPYVKHGGPSTPPEYFAVEAAGLRWLAAAGGAAVVAVREVGHHRIVLDRLETARPTDAAAEAFGHALARTHAAGAPAFGSPPEGWEGDGFIGRQRMAMRPTSTWGAFYAEQRLLPYAREAHDIGHLSAAGLAAVERVAERLRDGTFDDGRPPARLHGDLWSGNVVFTADGVVLIDPAAHGGHGLTDLAMLHLFGAPGLDRVSAAYAATAGLDPGWEDLVGLHQLHPLLVHAVSHGPAYGSEAAGVARRYR
jgi:fructosamine-3-kinase